MFDIIESFSSIDEWHAWAGSNALKTIDISSAISNIKVNGISSSFFGIIPPTEIFIAGDNYREQLCARELNSRQRAVLELLAINYGNRGTTKIYAPEAVTKLALELRGRFPYFVGSEYATTQENLDMLYPLPIENLLKLSYRSESFDVVISCDVLEHVPDIQQALSEMARITKPGGLMISTHPFTWGENSVIKSRMENGVVIHLQEPEYHGNPVDRNGSLVFTVPGWDILNTCISAGFCKSEMVMIASERTGIIGGDPPFINVLRAYK